LVGWLSFNDVDWGKISKSEQKSGLIHTDRNKSEQIERRRKKGNGKKECTCDALLTDSSEWVHCEHLHQPVVRKEKEKNWIKQNGNNAL
jgi:hypothetical protein